MVSENQTIWQLDSKTRLVCYSDVRCNWIDNLSNAFNFQDFGSTWRGLVATQSLGPWKILSILSTKNCRNVLEIIKNRQKRLHQCRYENVKTWKDYIAF
jgi:hypothetical protein